MNSTKRYFFIGFWAKNSFVQWDFCSIEYFFYFKDENFIILKLSAQSNTSSPKVKSSGRKIAASAGKTGSGSPSSAPKNPLRASMKKDSARKKNPQSSQSLRAKLNDAVSWGGEVCLDIFSFVLFILLNVLLLFGFFLPSYLSFFSLAVFRLYEIKEAHWG